MSKNESDILTISNLNRMKNNQNNQKRKSNKEYGKKENKQKGKEDEYKERENEEELIKKEKDEESKNKKDKEKNKDKKEKKENDKKKDKVKEEKDKENEEKIRIDKKNDNINMEDDKEHQFQEKKDIKKEGKGKTILKYKNKLKEIKYLEDEKKVIENKIKIKEIKKKFLKEEIKEMEENLKKEKNVFDKKIGDWEKKLDEKEKQLEQKSKRLDRMSEFLLPPNQSILIGLNNIGATCYMNATLQCFSNTKKLTEYFLYDFDYEKDKNKIISYEYYHLLRKLWGKKYNNIPYSPKEFKEVLSKENPLFQGIAANDSKDLVNFLLERFHQELNSVKYNNFDNNEIRTDINQINQSNENEMFKLFFDDFCKKYNSPISNMFYGILETKYKCNICNTFKFNFQV